MRLLSFTLKYHGRSQRPGPFVIVKQFLKSQDPLVDRLLAKGSLSYRFSDGDALSIWVRHVDGETAAELRRKSKGFLGYEGLLIELIEAEVADA